MNRFAELLDRLAYEPGRNNKLRLLTSYFREVRDPDRGYALAALTGALSFKHAKPGLIRDLITDRTDPVLFALSYDYVGDLSETVALMWPRSPSRVQSAPLPPRSGGEGWGGGGVSTPAPGPGCGGGRPPPPPAPPPPPPPPGGGGGGGGGGPPLHSHRWQ
jgi:DNA ligase-1